MNLFGLRLSDFVCTATERHMYEPKFGPHDHAKTRMERDAVARGQGPTTGTTPYTRHSKDMDIDR